MTTQIRVLFLETATPTHFAFCKMSAAKKASSARRRLIARAIGTIQARRCKKTQTFCLVSFHLCD